MLKTREVLYFPRMRDVRVVYTNDGGRAPLRHAAGTRSCARENKESGARQKGSLSLVRNCPAADSRPRLCVSCHERISNGLLLFAHQLNGAFTPPPLPSVFIVRFPSRECVFHFTVVTNCPGNEGICVFALCSRENRPVVDSRVFISVLFFFYKLQKFLRICA